MTEDMLALASVGIGAIQARLFTKIQASALVEEAVGSAGGLVLSQRWTIELGETTEEPAHGRLSTR